MQGFALGAAWLAGCGSIPPSPAPVAQALADVAFSIAGRISARKGDTGVAGAFTWTHDAPRDTISLATPLGQTLAELSGDASGVVAKLQGGRTESADTWRALTERAFGVTIPVDGLSAWVRGVPVVNTPFDAERDAFGRVALLRQGGWDVVYAYADDASQRPLRVTLTYPGADAVEVRVVVDQWR